MPDHSPLTLANIDRVGVELDFGARIEPPAVAGRPCAIDGERADRQADTKVAVTCRVGSNSCTHEARASGVATAPLAKAMRVSACTPRNVGSDVVVRGAKVRPRTPGAPPKVVLVSV